MKQVSYSISVYDEKLSALKRYMEKKNMDLDLEMSQAFQKLYDRHVPSAVREYIGESDTVPKVKRNTRSKATSGQCEDTALGEKYE